LNFEKYSILSLAGKHANETFEQIIKRKIKDIQNTGQTFWVENSRQMYPDIVKSFNDLANNEKIQLDCILYKGKDTQDTKTSYEFKEYSQDKKNWKEIDSKMSKVTGKLSNFSHAMVFDKLKLVNNEMLNLKNYVQYLKETPIRNYPSDNTFCAIKKHDEIELKQSREIFAIGRIHKLCSVWLR